VGTTTDTASASTLVGLLKNIKAALAATLTVSVSGTAATSVADGQDAALGAKADSAASNSTSSWSAVALLKGLYALLAGKLATTVADGDSATLGAKADSAATSSSASWSAVALLKGLYALLAGTLTVSVSGNPATKAQGAANGATSTVTVATTTSPATTLLASRATRQRAVVLNLDGTNAIWIAYANTVTTGSSGGGFRLKAGESLSLLGTGAIYGVAETASVQVSLVEEYN
jgi:hypothetical protein